MKTCKNVNLPCDNAWHGDGSLLLLLLLHLHMCGWQNILVWRRVACCLLLHPLKNVSYVGCLRAKQNVLCIGSFVLLLCISRKFVLPVAVPARQRHGMDHQTCQRVCLWTPFMCKKLQEKRKGLARDGKST